MGIKKSEWSPRAQALWGELDERTQKIIHKDYPFRNERDTAIRDLVSRGALYIILEEITGISDSALQDAVARCYGLDLKLYGKLLDELKKSFEMIHESLSMLLEGSGKNVQSKRKKDHR